MNADMDPMHSAIIAQLGRFIASDLLRWPGRVISPDEPLISSGLVSSFQLVDIALYVEEEFAVRIDDTELNSATFDTLDQLAALIETKRAAR